MDKKQKMIEINNRLLEASDAYYNKDIEIMSNYEYDALYDELASMERETGIILEDSITRMVGSDITLSPLEKVNHSHPMLSLAKTKSVDELIDWAGDYPVCASLKLDGLTIVITYEDGKLKTAATRGNGEIGEDVTEQARKFTGVPLTIPIKERVILRGEAVITYAEFDRINSLTDEGAKFKNPRNLASGTVKSLNLKVLDEREVRWVVFDVVEGHEAIYNWIENDCSSDIMTDTVGELNIDKDSLSFYLNALWTLGFESVENEVLIKNQFEKYVDCMSRLTNRYTIPVDGLVFTFDSIKLYESLGSTSHHPKGSIAFKWKDETYDTVIRNIEWSKSRTGRINPVAVFDPVTIDGTVVSRASLHNITYIENLKINIGDDVTVYKANMIIPQIAENNSKTLEDIEDILPECCPACGGEVVLRKETNKSIGQSTFLYCENPECDSSVVDQIALFLSKLRVMGISKTSIEKLYHAGILETLDDVFLLKHQKEEYCSLEGFGEKSFESLVEQIDNIETDLAIFISSLGILGVDTGTAKLISDKYGTFDEFLELSVDDLTSIDGIGDKTATSIVNFIESTGKRDLKELSKKVTILEVKTKEKGMSDFITGKNFAVTGTVNEFKNRKELQAYIESQGGKVTSVSSKTSYLINNDITSSSSKNRKAKELGVEIISEDEFIKRSGWKNEG